ncbi:MAG: RlmE family RNA methyltransferase [Phycisphaerae bacterium]|jgi:23S rRNA (uridine2552-2'-O)-methyltransferase|nr:RlmE family RNA methyltransferase [Phycisphaerae bacterium]MBT6269549.1 RlmE family RNA methyltransferase [Phycisphaerae bacterium]
MAAQRELHDFFFKEAKRKGYRSRAAYKLSEIDDKKNILSKGDFVLDLGAAPGSWLQVISERIGEHGKAIGVDLKEIEEGLPYNVVTRQEDVLLLTPKDFGGKLFDVVLSDMAPSTTGIKTIDHHGSVNLCHSALDLSATLLKPGGNLIMKVFEGEAYPELLKRCANSFDTARGYKPKASRAISTEMFIVCLNRNEDMPKPLSAAPSPPTSGWGTET